MEGWVSGSDITNNLINLANEFCDLHLSGDKRSEEVADTVFLLHVSAQARL